MYLCKLPDTHIHIHVYTHIHTYTWIYTYVHVHAYTHVYIYIHVCRKQKEGEKEKGALVSSHKPYNVFSLSLSHVFWGFLPLVATKLLEDKAHFLTYNQHSVRERRREGTSLLKAFVQFFSPPSLESLITCTTYIRPLPFENINYHLVYAVQKILWNCLNVGKYDVLMS